MSSDPDSPDEWLLAQLADAITALDPVPGPVLASARAAYDLHRGSGAEIAELRADSALTPLTGFRGPAGTQTDPRYLDFHSADLAIHIEVTTSDEGRDIVGHLSPAGASATVVSVQVRWPDGQRAGRLQPTGAFVARAVPAGAMSLVCRRSFAPPVATSWVCV